MEQELKYHLQLGKKLGIHWHMQVFMADFAEQPNSRGKGEGVKSFYIMYIQCKKEGDLVLKEFPHVALVFMG